MSDDRNAEVIDLGAFADPAAQCIMLAKASLGAEWRLRAIQDELRREESRGWCQIVHMDDRIAVVRWNDQFVLEINEASPAQLGGQEVVL